MGITFALMVSWLWVPDLEATVTTQVTSSKTITLSRSSDFGVSSSTGDPMAQGTMTAVEIDPLGTFTGSITVPVSQIGTTADTVADDGTITKPLASSSTVYIWRATISGGSNTSRTTEKNALMSTLVDTYAFAESLGNMTGNLSHTSNSSRKLAVTLAKGTLSTTATGSTTPNPSYVWRNLNLIINLNNVRYSGNYTGALNSILTCPGYIN